MQGLVYKSTGSWYLLKDEDGKLWNARIKGVFKIDDDITSTNPIAVGDVVDLEMENEAEQSAMILMVPVGAMVVTVAFRLRRPCACRRLPG